MAIELVDDKPGLWVERSLIDRPATHALVIGVSQYTHLDGGSGPRANQTYGLGQLSVSALTAYRFFEWLRDKYHHGVAPVGSIQLLLAPNPEELAASTEMAGAYLSADFENCELALNSWRQILSNLPPTVAGPSRSLFFFSGHGLEITQQKQILLLSDYLRPDKPSLNRAISTLNLKQGLLTLAVCDQLFFVDACRNGSQQLAGAEVEGMPLFDVTAPHHNNPDVNSAVMYGTASGAQSWQPAHVSDGLSLFGTALLEAVAGRAKIDLTETPPTIWFSDVASYTNLAVRRQLLARGAQVRQAIRGDLAFVGVVHADAPTTGPGDGEIPLPGLPGSGELVPAGVESISRDVTFAGSTPSWDRELHVADGEEWEPFEGSDDPHTWFGREQLTEVWTDHTTAVDLVTGSPVPISVRGGHRFAASQQRLRISADRDNPTWLTIAAPNETYAATLPGGRDVEYELGLVWSDANLVHVEVDLSPACPPPLGEIGRLWVESRETDPASVAHNISRRDVELAVETVRTKVASPLSPLGALVASLVLLRAGPIDAERADPIPEPWARNMATLPQFVSLPDGAALWAEVLSRMGSRAPESPSQALALLAERDFAPLTDEGVGYALAIAEVLSVATPADDPLAKRMQRIHQWLSGIARFSDCGGLFLVMSGPADQVGRDRLLTPPSLQ